MTTGAAVHVVFPNTPANHKRHSNGHAAVSSVPLWVVRGKEDGEKETDARYTKKYKVMYTYTFQQKNTSKRGIQYYQLSSYHHYQQLVKKVKISIQCPYR